MHVWAVSRQHTLPNECLLKETKFGEFSTVLHQAEVSPGAWFVSREVFPFDRLVFGVKGTISSEGMGTLHVIK